jgi:type IV pilus assembly protein PilV
MRNDLNTPRPLTDRPHSRSRGFTLLEILVALLILTIGLLGLGTLQMTSLRYNHSALLRSQATLLAQDILDRMRANRATAVGGSYVTGLTETAAIIASPAPSA